MNPPFEPSQDLVPVDHNLPVERSFELPAIVGRAGAAAIFAAEEFFYGTIRNEHTRKAYQTAIRRFLLWAEKRKLELGRIAPKDVGQYFDGLQKEDLSIATRKQHLAALRHFFDGMVTRHAIILNPALSVRGERYQVVEGKTPEITVAQARTLLASLETPTPAGLRDRAIIAILIYTAARAGAISKLRCSSFYDSGGQWMLHFDEKSGKSREIPVRHDLAQIIFEYLDAADLHHSPADSPLLRSAIRKTGKLTERAMHPGDICQMVKTSSAWPATPTRVPPASTIVATRRLRGTSSNGFRFERSFPAHTSIGCMDQNGISPL